MASAFTPKIGSSAAIGASASCPSVAISILASARSAEDPMPDMAVTGKGSRNARSVPGKTTVRPRGLSRSLAILAIVLFDPSPMEQVIPSSDTRLEMRDAISRECTCS